LFRWALRREEIRARHKGGVRVDFQNGYWVPPLSPRTAYELESRQIGEKLFLESIVSLTDHDNIEAPTLLRMLPESEQIPISLEWSVPDGGTELHLGVHNLPAKDAQAIVSDLNGCTARPSTAAVRELLIRLHRMPEVLVVLNHPMWDLCRVGEQHHREAVLRFLCAFGQHIHALELNGLRSWEENQRVADLAAGWNLPVVSGGDRHGYEPSGCVSLTNASTFSEFAEEVRRGQSHVLFMPQYAESLTLRIIRTVNDAVRSYLESPVGARWDDRVYHPDRDGVMRPLSQLWQHAPAYIGSVFSVLRMLESAPMQRLASAFRRPEQRLDLTWGGEVS
jgi:hypothetical protein